MAVKKFDKIFYRTAAAPITTIAFSGSTPAGWTYRDWETDRKSTRLNSSH